MKMRTLSEAVEGMLAGGKVGEHALVLVSREGRLYPLQDVHGELVDDDDDAAKLMVMDGTAVKVPMTVRDMCTRIQEMPSYTDIDLQFQDMSVEPIGDCVFHGYRGVLIIQPA